MLKKIGLIGGGYIGGVLTQEIVQRRLAREVGLVDPAPFVNPDDPPERQEVTKKQSVSKGKCLDIAEGTPTIRTDVRCVGSKDYSALAGAELIINTAGVPRKARPDGTFPTREELLTINLKVTKQVAEGIKQYCPKAIIISIANPLDAIVYTLDKALAPPKNKLFGMAGQLDSGRYCYFVAEAANVSVENVNAMVLGGHGDDMVPVRSSCLIAGIPVDQVPRRGDAGRDRDPHPQGGRRGRRPARLRLGLRVAGVGGARDGRGDHLRQAQDHPGLRQARGRVRRQRPVRRRSGHRRRERRRAGHRARPHRRREGGVRQVGAPRSARPATKSTRCSPASDRPSSTDRRPLRAGGCFRLNVKTLKR